VILLLVFGARRLPEIGRSLGSGMREFKESVTGESRATIAPGQQAPPSVAQPPAAAPAAAPAPVAPAEPQGEPTPPEPTHSA
jgi:sec-independent protein translocase protein TatA